MRIDKQRLLATFEALVAIDSPSFGEGPMAAHLRERLEALGLAVTGDAAGAGHEGGSGNLYGFLEGDAAAPALLFCAHMDTVEPAHSKRAVIGEDGVIRSSGDTVLGADDAAGVAAILEALQAIREQQLPHRPIEVLFTVAEELYCAGAAIFDFSTVKSKEAYVLDLAGPVGTAAHRAPSILLFTATVTGKSAHAGFAPEQGVHAVAVAARAVSRLRMGRVDEETTLNVGVVTGGRAANVVPDECVVRGEARSFSHANAEARIEEVRRIFQEEADAAGAQLAFEVSCVCEAYEIAADHPVIRRFQAACAVQKLTPVLEQTFGGSDNNWLMKRGVTGLVIAPGMYQCHTCQEYTTVEDLERSAGLALSLMAPDEPPGNA